MTSRLGLRLLALALPVALLAPAAAQARTLTVDDAAGDALAINMAVALGGFITPTTEEGPFFLDAPAEANLSGYVDDALRGGVSMKSLGRSPKVRRG